jgi:hypothetical protein
MPSPWSASIKLLYTAYANTFFTMRLINVGEPFDVIAHVENGENLSMNVDSFDLWVFIRNLSQSTTPLRNQLSRPLTPTASDPYRDEIRVGFTGGWNANEGDILQAVAVYKVSAGVTSDYTTAESDILIVSA